MTQKAVIARFLYEYGCVCLGSGALVSCLTDIFLFLTTYNSKYSPRGKGRSYQPKE